MRDYTPTEMAEMLQAVKFTPPTPQMPVTGGLSMLSQIVCRFVFAHQEHTDLMAAYHAFDTKRLNLHHATDDDESWMALVASADALATTLRSFTHPSSKPADAKVRCDGCLRWLVAGDKIFEVRDGRRICGGCQKENTTQPVVSSGIVP